MEAVKSAVSAEAAALQRNLEMAADVNAKFDAAFPPRPKRKVRKAYKSLIKYLKAKVRERDWHAVSDAANDIRVRVAKHPGLEP